MTRLGRVLAVRRLRQARTRRGVAVRLGQPRCTRNNWLVPVEIRGLGRTETRCIYGVDAIQALMLAIEFLRIRLASVEPPLARLDRLVDAEGARWAQALERTHRRRRRPAR